LLLKLIPHVMTTWSAD